MGRGLALLWAPLALLWAAWGCEGRIRNDGADELFVEYEDYELPDNETGAQHSPDVPCVRTPPHPASCSVTAWGRLGPAPLASCCSCPAPTVAPARQAVPSPRAVPRAAPR